MKQLRGWFGEKKTTFSMWFSLNSDVYQRFHNIIIAGSNGTTQIDHLLVSPFGLFIVETKNLKGWIFGSEKQRQWTQVIYRRKYRFQNPVFQTFRQKKVLSEFLNIDASVIHTIVYFVGDCRFKTQLPTNVLKSRLGRYIRRFKDLVLAPEDVKRITRILERHLSESTLTRRDHMRSLRERHSSTSTCPRCGSRLVTRIAKKGPNAGSKFLGCKDYPRCRFTKNA